MLFTRSVVVSLMLLMSAPSLAQANSIKDSPPPKIHGDAKPVTQTEARRVLQKYGSIPGGVMLEGTGKGVDWVKGAAYDKTRNAFILDDRIAYRSPVSPEIAASLLRAIILDDRIGVSLGKRREIVYGQLAADSEVATDMKLLDSFLGEIVLPPQYWTIGYKYANGFKPVTTPRANAPAVFFQFDDFAFQVVDDTLRLVNADFHVRLVPVKSALARDGGYLPDFEAIGNDGRLARYLINARHVADNFAYYAREDIVRKTLVYGEVAALFRAFKAAKINLRALEQQVGGAVSYFRLTGLLKVIGLEPQDLESHWRRYLRKIQYQGHFANWVSPPYDLYLARN